MGPPSAPDFPADYPEPDDTYWEVCFDASELGSCAEIDDVGFGATTHLPGSPAAMQAHGYLPIDQRRAIAVDALARIVRPAACELLRRGYAPPTRALTQ